MCIEYSSRCDVFAVEVNEADNPKENLMCEQHPNGLVNFVGGKWLFEEAAPTGHVCSEKEGANLIKDRNVKCPNDGKQNDNGHGGYNRTYRIIRKTG